MSMNEIGKNFSFIFVRRWVYKIVEMHIILCFLNGIDENS